MRAVGWPRWCFAACLWLGCAKEGAEPAVPSSRAAPEPRPPSEPSPVPAPRSEPAQPPATAPEAEPTKADALELTFVGDVIFGRYRDAGYDPIPIDGFDEFEPMAAALRSDVLVGNLETPVVRDLPARSPIGARFRFGASAEHAKLLAAAGFTAVSLANNHWYDQRVEGVEQTPEVLREIGVVPLGAAVRQPPVFRVESVEAKGWRLGFVAITARSNAPVREGGPILPYLTTYDIGKTIGPLLQQARSDHDLLVVVVHWGDEYVEAPSHPQRVAAHALIDAGADLVVGHHPHVLQGFERYGRGFIAYSLGNFLFENTNDPPRLTGVLRVRADRDRRCLARVVFHPAYIKRMPTQHPVPARGHLGKRVKERVRRLSKALGTAWVDEADDLVLADPGCDSADPQ